LVTSDDFMVCRLKGGFDSGISNNHALVDCVTISQMPYFIKSPHYGSIASSGYTALARVYLNTLTPNYGVNETNTPKGPKR
jgi:hypothetical protein